MNEECIFCKIVRGEIPSKKVFEGRGVIAFLDINPASKGHTLVIPKKHFENFLDISEEDLKELIVSAQKIAKAVQKATASEGFNIHVSTGKAAGQVVFHLHIHIVPRTSNDNVGLKWTHVSYAEGEAQELLEKIVENMD